jgi:hypothetical protein
MMARDGNDWCVRSRRGRAARQDAAVRFQAPASPESFVHWALTEEAQRLLDAYAAERGAFPIGGAR